MRLDPRPIVILATTALCACATPPKPEPAAAQPVVVAASPLSVLGPRRNLSGLNGTVVRYLIDGKAYYYVRSPCCDLHNHLYDSAGDYLCAPDGGFTGRGDGRCPAHVRIRQSEGTAMPNPFFRP